jgi:hypothetical protein
MTYELRPIHKESIPHALEKAERYRLLNEPFLAESICLDILAIDRENQKALVVYILSLADQCALGAEDVEKRARAEIERLTSEFDRAYYAGIVCERRALALITRGSHGAAGMAYHYLEDAMRFYEEAQRASAPGLDDAILRFNTCVRMIERHRLVRPTEEPHEYPLE